MSNLSKKAIQILHASLITFVNELTEDAYDEKTPLIDYLRHQLTGTEFASAFPPSIKVENIINVFNEVDKIKL